MHVDTIAYAIELRHIFDTHQHLAREYLRSELHGLTRRIHNQIRTLPGVDNPEISWLDTYGTLYKEFHNAYIALSDLELELCVQADLPGAITAYVHRHRAFPQIDNCPRSDNWMAYLLLTDPNVLEQSIHSLGIYAALHRSLNDHIPPLIMYRFSHILYSKPGSIMRRIHSILIPEDHIMMYKAIQDLLQKDKTCIISVNSTDPLHQNKPFVLLQMLSASKKHDFRPQRYTLGYERILHVWKDIVAPQIRDTIYNMVDLAKAYQYIDLPNIKTFPQFAEWILNIQLDTSIHTLYDLYPDSIYPLIEQYIATSDQINTILHPLEMPHE